MIFFTILSRNFTAYANTLYYSLREFYPDLRFYAVICDDLADYDYQSLPYPVLDINELGISKIEQMKVRYNITELNTSLKPFAFECLFSLHPGQPVVYLDPDIFILSRLHELEEQFEAGADCILTPHICEPAEYAEMTDLSFLKYGIYNFGFCGMRDTADTRRIVAWWARRLEDSCVIDFANGLFVDQKFGDYFPAFIEKTSVLRHPGYNVAYWNLAQRRIARNDAGWAVNAAPLRFIHFSGNRIEDDGVFTRHAGQFNTRNTPELGELLQTYRKSIFANGHNHYSVIPYAFSWSGASLHNEHTPEGLQRRPTGAARPHLPLARYTSLEQWQADRDHNSRNLAERASIELQQIPDDEVFSLDGFCWPCDAQRSFITSGMYASRKTIDGRTIPNWREHLGCNICGLPNRVRAFINILDQEFALPAESDVYITEQVTTLYTMLKKRWPRLIGSEYMSPHAPAGSDVGGIRHEDVQAISLADNSLDLILSLDVLEHVPFPERAFAELYRCLRPGGGLLFSVPFSYNNSDDVIRAVMLEDGSINHLLEPEYHGNPVDMDNGALCYRYFSWNVVSALKAVGFDQVEVLSYWSNELKYLGDPQTVIVARKGMRHDV